jgi:long-subunit fatty acid transport protein
LVLSIQATSDAGALLFDGSGLLRGDLGGAAFGSRGVLRFTQSAFMPELAAELGTRAQLRVGVTIASQRFATPGFGEVRAQGQMLGLSGFASTGGSVEQSFGQGVHAAIASRIADRVELGLSAQSRVDMDAFKSYRGVFTEPGDFDMPARTGLSMGWQAADPLTFTLGAERVFFGGVNAFTTRALPPRFLAFLGDGSSPQFAWRDLTVYSAQAAFNDTFGGQWGLRWTSRQQPSPTSTLLDLALRDTYSNTNLSASYRRNFGEVGSLNFGASYAPSQYILGAGSFGSRFSDGAQLEVELNWSMAF